MHAIRTDNLFTIENGEIILIDGYFLDYDEKFDNGYILGYFNHNGMLNSSCKIYSRFTADSLSEIILKKLLKQETEEMLTQVREKLYPRRSQIEMETKVRDILFNDAQFFQFLKTLNNYKNKKIQNSSSPDFKITQKDLQEFLGL